MNTNEVIANLANEALARGRSRAPQRPEYQPTIDVILLSSAAATPA